MMWDMEPSAEMLPVSDELKRAIERAAAELKAYGAREVYVFGSVASGRIRADSDVDFAVVGLPDEVFFRAMGRAHIALGIRELDLIPLDDDTPFTRYLREENGLIRVA